MGNTSCSCRCIDIDDVDFDVCVDVDNIEGVDAVGSFGFVELAIDGNKVEALEGTGTFDVEL